MSSSSKSARIHRSVGRKVTVIIPLVVVAMFVLSNFVPQFSLSPIKSAQADSFDPNVAANYGYNHALDNSGECTALLVASIRYAGLNSVSPSITANNVLLDTLKNMGLIATTFHSDNGIIPTNVQPGDLVFMTSDAHFPSTTQNYWDHSAIITAHDSQHYIAAWNTATSAQLHWFDYSVQYNVPYMHFLIVRLAVPAPTAAPPANGDVVVTVNGGPTDKTGNSAYFYNAQAGSTVSGGGSVYTFVNAFNSGRDNSIKYKPGIPKNGCYEIALYIPYILNNDYDSANVPVEVKSHVGVTVLHENYETYNNQLGSKPTYRWLSIGTFAFDANAGNIGQYVWISDNTGEAAANSVNTSRAVSFDSVKFSFRGDFSNCIAVTPTATVPAVTPTKTVVPPTKTVAPPTAQPCPVQNMALLQYSNSSDHTITVPASCAPHRFPFVVSPAGPVLLDIQKRDNSGFQYQMNILDSTGKPIGISAHSTVDSRGVIQANLNGNYILEVVPLSATTIGAYGLALYTGTAVLSFNYDQSFYCDVTHVRYYLTSGGKYWISVQPQQSPALSYTVKAYKPTNVLIGSGSSVNGSVNVQINDNATGWFDVNLNFNGTCGSYLIRLHDGTMPGAAPVTPPPATPAPVHTATPAPVTATPTPVVVPVLTVSNVSVQKIIIDGQKGSFSFDVNNPTSIAITTKIRMPMTANLPSQFQSWPLASFTATNASAIPSVTIAAHSTYHVTGQLSPLYSWNTPANAECAKLDYGFIVTTFTDYAKGVLYDAAGVGWYNHLKTASDALTILGDGTLVRGSATFTAVPQLDYAGLTTYGSAAQLQSQVPQNKIDQFSAGIGSEISGVLLADAPGLNFLTGPIAALAGANLYIFGCVQTLGSVIP